MASYATVVIDGSDYTNVAIAGSWTPRLNRPAQAQVTIPMDSAPGPIFVLGSIAPNILKLYIDGSLVFHGFVMNSETDTGKDTGTTVFNAMDPMELWQWRYVLDADGDYSDPGIITDFNYAPDILWNALDNTRTIDGDILVDLGSPAVGTNTVNGAPTDWPMTVAELASLLISSGQLDVVITPTDPGSSIMGTVDFYNGDYGTDLSGSVNFQYGMGAFNVDSVRWNRDMTNVMNNYTILGGPKVATAADPKAIQHWCYNITGDDSSIPGFGVPGSPFEQAIVRRVNSQFNFAPRLRIDIFDGYDNCQGVGTVGRTLQQELWIEYSFFASIPREIIHVTPTRDTEIGTFGIGDIVGVEAVSDVAGGFSGKQRVYEYTVSWDEDSVLALSELQTSSDADFAA